MRAKTTTIFIWCLMITLPDVSMADAGPPFLTNDPGTPGNGNLEINLGSMATVDQRSGSYQIPQLDVNLGLGDRIQFTYEVDRKSVV